jgi:hypothetical protein
MKRTYTAVVTFEIDQDESAAEDLEEEGEAVAAERLRKDIEEELNDMLVEMPSRIKEDLPLYLVGDYLDISYLGCEITENKPAEAKAIEALLGDVSGHIDDLLNGTAVVAASDEDDED